MLECKYLLFIKIVKSSLALNSHNLLNAHPLGFKTGDIMHLTLIIIALLVTGLILLIFQYNKLKQFKNKVEASWSNIDTQLRRRYALLPDLTQAVAPYTKYDKAVFNKINAAHNQATSAGNVLHQATAEKQLSQSIKSLFAISENYPDLKTNENFRNIQQELSEVEDKMQLGRRHYNTIVKGNNNFVNGFPGLFVARLLGFGKYDFFEIE